MKPLTECTHAELEDYVKDYPVDLRVQVSMSHRPPLVTFNDFGLGMHPECVVASYSMGDLPGRPHYYGPATNFKIRKMGAA
jgi:hypothetical protein